MPNQYNFEYTSENGWKYKISFNAAQNEIDFYKTSIDGKVRCTVNVMGKNNIVISCSDNNMSNILFVDHYDGYDKISYNNRFDNKPLANKNEIIFNDENHDLLSEFLFQKDVYAVISEIIKEIEKNGKNKNLEQITKTKDSIYDFIKNHGRVQVSDFVNEYIDNIDFPKKDSLSRTV